MDPASIVALIGTAGAIASTITKTIRGLSDLRAQYTDANVRIRLLIKELSTIKSSLNQINDWAHFLDETHNQAELRDALHVALDGVDLAMGALAEEVQALVDDISADSNVHLGLRAKTKYAWNEQNMREHENRLRAQVSALQLLLQASHWLVVPSNRVLLVCCLIRLQCIKTGASRTLERPTESSHHPESCRGLHNPPGFNEYCRFSNKRPNNNNG